MAIKWFGEFSIIALEEIYHTLQRDDADLYQNNRDEHR